jgi:hypothetical protein
MNSFIKSVVGPQTNFEQWSPTHMHMPSLLEPQYGCPIRGPLENSLLLSQAVPARGKRITASQIIIPRLLVKINHQALKICFILLLSPAAVHRWLSFL